MAFISSSSFFPSAPLSHPKKKVPWSQLAPTSLYRIFPFLPCLISQVASISSPFINSYACVIWFALAPFVPVTPAAWKYPKQSAFKQPSFFFCSQFCESAIWGGLGCAVCPWVFHSCSRVLARAEGSVGLASRMAHSHGWLLTVVWKLSWVYLLEYFLMVSPAWQAQASHGSQLSPETVLPEVQAGATWPFLVTPEVTQHHLHCPVLAEASSCLDPRGRDIGSTSQWEECQWILALLLYSITPLKLPQFTFWS